MSKPWEETWDNGRDFEVTVSGPELDRDIDAPREVLARAAPDMARALLALGSFSSNEPGSRWHLEECWESHEECPERCKRIQAALKKAGVL